MNEVNEDERMTKKSLETISNNWKKSKTESKKNKKEEKKKKP